MTTQRPDPPLTAGERETLRAFLDYHRGTLAVSCAGLSDHELRRAPVASSALTVRGLVRHMAEVRRARHNGHADLLPEGIDGTVGV